MKVESRQHVVKAMAKTVREHCHTPPSLQTVLANDTTPTAIAVDSRSI
jgi:hypothetical protein